jgi:valyl-tRNA synthetase
MKKELLSKYDASLVEKGKYQFWLDNNLFSEHDESKPAFTIVIPPPNVTGKLHLGHAWDETMQDMIIRYKKLRGYDTLYLPGMDHAGIATQAKIEQRLREKGISRYDLGREKFLEVAWDWKKEYADFIRSQWAKLGLALDYTKERFTLDEGLNKAVNKVFVTLYEKGLIYQGEKIINYDPVQKTALSNIEVIYKETESYLYYFKYYLEGSNDEFLEVATTRPETMFGDVCVVVNPNDERYTKYVGKKVINPANNQAIIVIADEYVDVNFGTGAMKCTPAHDPNDFILGEKYNLPRINCMNNDGTINELGGKYANLDRFEARKQLVEDLKANGKVSKIEKHINQVGYSERSDAIVEPYLSKQWFVKMKPLAEQALKQQETEGKVNFYPERFEKVFKMWLDNIEDWCISRQLWWGHRIPAYYHKTTGEIYVGINPPTDIENYTQDEDVLDTWFSSALWPFSTLGWPEATPDFNRYYPTNALVTGYDIIFFWVARMIFQGTEFTHKGPFKDVLLHGLIRDSQGRKMSKSLGNGIDPIDVIEKYGADTLRYFLTTNSTPGLDLRYQEEKVESSWNFINKIWNASRFVLHNLPENFTPSQIELEYASTPDKWILTRLNETIKAVNENMDKYEFGVAGNYLYNFIWDDFCSWYIEMSKVSLHDEDLNKVKATTNVLYYVLMSIIKLVHPFIPFVTEEIYQALTDENASIMRTSWPEVKDEFTVESDETVMQAIIDIVTSIRNLRNDENIAPTKKIDINLGVSDHKILEMLELNRTYIEKFTYANTLTISSKIAVKAEGKTFILKNVEIFVPLAGLVDVKEQIESLTKELTKLEGEIKRCENMLSNPSFLSKAPQAKVNEEQAKLEDYKVRYEKAKQLLTKLSK